MKETRAKAPGFVAIDAGDSLVSADAKRKGAVDAQIARKAELMADYLGIAKPDAVSLGELDLARGPSTAAGLLGARGIVPVVTNATFADVSVKTVPFAAWQVSGYRFVAVNLFHPRAAAGLPGVVISEPLAALDAALAAAGECDVLLVSCHRFDDALMKRLAEREGPLRIAIDADATTRVRISDASATARTIFAKPPPRGTDLLTVDLYLLRGAPAWYLASRYEDAVRKKKPTDEELESASECSLADFNQRRLEGNVKGDPEVLKKIEEYKAWTRHAALASAPDDPNAPKYAGAAACGECHKEQLANWKTTLHAHAWESLEKDPDGGAQDPECVSCHVSGFLQPGGVRRLEDIGLFKGVQCESCHAPIAQHPGGAKYPKLTEAACRTCHSETRDPDFKFAEYLKYATCTKPHDPNANHPPR